jgi:predicted metal-dependent phosphoesterase TrpH
MKIDLHTHSAHSDGTQTPEELVAEAAVYGIDVMALTDHDTYAGWAEALAAGEKHGVRILRGVEISCQASDGISVHLLAYLPDPAHAALRAVLHDARDSRDVRARRMVSMIAEEHPLEWGDVLAVAGEGATIGRPHIADALIARNVVKSREEAFGGILGSRSRFFVPHSAPRPETAVRLVRAAGGVPVFAHPRARARGRVVGVETLEAMIEAGLAGLEVDHRDNPPEDRAWLRETARERDLIITGSSDFHGRGKPNLLGEHTTAPEMLERILSEVRSGLT